MWSLLYRSRLFTMGNNTTNRIERFDLKKMIAKFIVFIAAFFHFCRYHNTIKDYFQHRQRRFAFVIKCLISIVRHRLNVSEQKRLDAEIRFPVQRFSPVLEQLRAMMTPYSWKIVEEQSTSPTTSYSIIKVFINL